jgi:hypothetical protein
MQPIILKKNVWYSCRGAQGKGIINEMAKKNFCKKHHNSLLIMVKEKRQQIVEKNGSFQE